MVENKIVLVPLARGAGEHEITMDSMGRIRLDKVTSNLVREAEYTHCTFLKEQGNLSGDHFFVQFHKQPLGKCYKLRFSGKYNNCYLNATKALAVLDISPYKDKERIVMTIKQIDKAIFKIIIEKPQVIHEPKGE